MRLVRERINTVSSDDLSCLVLRKASLWQSDLKSSTSDLDLAIKLQAREKAHQVLAVLAVQVVDDVSKKNNSERETTSQVDEIANKHST